MATFETTKPQKKFNQKRKTAKKSHKTTKPRKKSAKTAKPQPPDTPPYPKMAQISMKKNKILPNFERLIGRFLCKIER